VKIQSPDNPLETLRAIDVNPAGATDPYSSNPQTVVWAMGKLYVISSGRNEVVIIDPATGTVTGMINLFGFVVPGDMDGLVDMVDAIAVDDLLYVALSRYWIGSDFGIHFEGSILVAIDMTTDEVKDLSPVTPGTQTIELLGQNPWRGLALTADGNRLLVGSAGDSFAIDGGIERVDLAESGSIGFMVTEEQLGYELQGFEVVSASDIAVLAGGRIVHWNPMTESLSEPLVTEIAGILLHDDSLNAWGATGLRRFRTSDWHETTPAAGPWTFGAFPIQGVAPSP
jgi:YVTN family beta-propeller protein